MNQNQRILYTIIGIAISVVAFLMIITLFGNKAEAISLPKVYICHVENPDEGGVNQQTLHIAVAAAIAHLTQHDADYSGECEEPEVTPTPTPTPEPDVDYCDTVEGTQTEDYDCPKDEPTCEELQNCEEPEEPVYPYIHVDSWSQPEPAKAPAVCSITNIGDVANIVALTGTPNDGKIEVQWSLPENADKVHIVYREYSESGWTHALLNTPNDGNEVIGELKNGVNYAFAVAGVRDCGVGKFSQEYDPMP
jgi:hypothetical protein